MLKEGDKPTFARGRQTFIIDFTLASADIAQDIGEWRVTEEKNLSDHNNTHFFLKHQATKTRVAPARRGWVWKEEKSPIEKKYIANKTKVLNPLNITLDRLIEIVKHLAIKP